MTAMTCFPLLTRLAGTCLAGVLAGGSAALAAGGMTAPPGPGLPVVLTAARSPQAPVPNPDPPIGLAAAAGDGRVTLSWQPPASDRGTAIIGYDIYLGTSSHGESPDPVNGTLISGTSVTVAGLSDGTTYYFTAEAVNHASRHSAASAEVSATPPAAISQPGSPNGLAASPGDGRITLSWQAPGSDGGAAISGYEIYLGTRPGGESRVPVNGSLVRGTSVVLAGLANGTTYYFTVAAVNQANRQGAASGEDSAIPIPVTAGQTVTGASAKASAGAAATAVLASPQRKVPKLVIVVLAAVAVGALAAALTLSARRMRKRPRPRPAAPPSDVRAGPGQGAPGPAGTGTEHPAGPWEKVPPR